MKLSWSHKLFLRINSQIGQRPALDAFMVFCGKYLISLIIIFVGLVTWFFIDLGYPDWRDSRGLVPVLVLFTGMVLMFALSHLMAFIFKKRRPVVEMPQSKQLITTLNTWKSFPSDHTALAFYFAFFIIYSTRLEFLFISIPIFVIATLVAIGRVYVGVHYPRDIVGGVLLALFSLGIVILYQYQIWQVFNKLFLA